MTACLTALYVIGGLLEGAGILTVVVEMRINRERERRLAQQARPSFSRATSTVHRAAITAGQGRTSSRQSSDLAIVARSLKEFERASVAAYESSLAMFQEIFAGRRTIAIWGVVLLLLGLAVSVAGNVLSLYQR